MLQQVGKYQIVEKIGVGGFGSVYKGRDPFIKRLVAIKTCQSDEEEIKKRFFREAEFAGNLHHRNITTIYDFGVTDEGVPYIVQEFLTGEDLDRKIKSKEPLPISRKVRILMDICEGLGYAHGQGIVHRDIKPSNVRILEDGTVKIMDFGIAKSMVSQSTLTQTGITLGTASYLAPEQIRGEEVDPRTDIFSLGVLAYELFLYQKPFTGDHISTVLYKILNEQPPAPHEADPSIPEELSKVVLRAISKSREERQASCAELRSALFAAAAFLPDDAPSGLRAPLAPSSADDEKTMATPSGGFATMGGGPRRPEARSLADLPVRSASPSAPAAGPLADVKLGTHTDDTLTAPQPEEAPSGSPMKLFLLSLAFVVLVGAVGGWLFLGGKLPIKPHDVSPDAATPTPSAAPAPEPATASAPATTSPASTAVAPPTPAPTATPAPPTPTPLPKDGYAVVHANYHAELTVDGKRIPGGVEMAPRSLPLRPGRHTLVFSSAGVPDVTKTVEIRPGEKSEASAEFPSRGQLRIQLAYEAQNAMLFLDEKPLEKGPMVKVNVRAGKHKLTAMLEGYQTWMQYVDVPEQDAVTVNIVMKKLPADAPKP